ncbi:hypothetical protein PRABACTJOHN_03048 [Parabacteroides johnsonii DSM 18315]|uniref:Uncharacterized protein n=1 Tax=Parabacteroides johnsonii DSM 18315 TaxID=537006 RepID=B7BDC8_9BACT|nr:hypothetical protein PRABACTJOHN_03048 [Parabacteroides johnsonii DSM 18315]
MKIKNAGQYWRIPRHKISKLLLRTKLLKSLQIYENKSLS